MMQRVVILGGGTAGTLTANRLQRELGGQAAITVVDRDDDHWYQPGLLFVPFGRANPGTIARSRARQLRPGIGYHHKSPVDHVDIGQRRVHLEDGTVLPYEVLVVATGAAPASSKAGSARRCSSTSTTTPSRWPGGSPGERACRC